MRNPSYKTVVSFHGHSCPGLAIGYRAALYALKRLGRDRDEEIAAVVENDSCSVDAVQALCSCTFGKGNLYFLDRGKQAFTFFKRGTAEGFRVYVEAPQMPEADVRLQERLSALKRLSPAQRRQLEAVRQRRIKAILRAPQEQVLKISRPTVKLPGPAVIRQSARCAVCGERVMSTRLSSRGKKFVCAECAG